MDAAAADGAGGCGGCGCGCGLLSWVFWMDEWMDSLTFVVFSYWFM